MISTNERVFIVFPDGRIEEVDDEGDSRDYDPDPSLYDELVKAGYPTSYHGDFSPFDAIIDLRVVGDQVTVLTPGPKLREHDMGAWRGAVPGVAAPVRDRGRGGESCA